jgi:hypothetical protein
MPSYHGVQSSSQTFGNTIVDPIYNTYQNSRTSEAAGAASSSVGSQTSTYKDVAKTVWGWLK